ncbi:MAG: adenylate/guanylate cyclase domain-containing protein [Flavobacteriales bacterium]|jgi:adenylate cyclase|nr:MAG: adenylate/guanylate cyclase domain-containing protein [Flavobacteriales bacterium]
MNAITRYKLRKLAKYALVAAIVALVLTLFSGEGMSAAIFGSWMLLGLWTGVLEEYFFGRRFRALAVPLQFLGKVLLVNLFTILLIGIAWLWGSERFTMIASDTPYRMHEIFGMAQFYQLVLRVVVVSSIAILVVQVEEWMGRRTFLGFLLGRYERPKREERVVLSLDLVGSTEIAERLGDMRYYRFLNQVYSLMTDAVLRNEADIHKYVGDEVIFTWPMRVGIRRFNCLDLYFDITARIAEHENDLKREFGLVPRFRAGLHGGRVLSAQVGHIKRTVDLSGDVMNSVSRMLGLAKAMKTDILVSAELLERMPDAGRRFEIGPQHLVPVKGKRREVRVHVVRRHTLEP